MLYCYVCYLSFTTVALLIFLDDIHCFLEYSCSIFSLSLHIVIRLIPRITFIGFPRQIEITFSTIGRKREMETRINFTVKNLFSFLVFSFYYLLEQLWSFHFFPLIFSTLLLIFITHCTLIHRYYTVMLQNLLGFRMNANKNELVLSLLYKRDGTTDNELYKFRVFAIWTLYGIYMPELYHLNWLDLIH